MRAVQFNEYGGAEVLHLTSLPVPEVGSDSVRMTIRSIGLNPADTKWRQGMFRQSVPLRLPHVLGYDVAGEIDAVGWDVTAFEVGDRVFSMIEMGGYAEYAVLPAAHAVRIPEGLDFAHAAALPTAALTGVQMIEDYLRPSSGQQVLVTGATGAVGRCAVFAALRRGARVIAAVRPAQARQALALGVSDLVLLGEQTWNGAAFDCIADTVGGPAVAALCRHLAPAGTICTVATTPIEGSALVREPVSISRRFDPSQLAEIAQWVAAGQLDIPIADRLPLAQVGHAHRLIERGGVGGKLILEPWR
jgi:NADPH2:quinone reductase